MSGVLVSFELLTALPSVLFAKVTNLGNKVAIHSIGKVVDMAILGCTILMVVRVEETFISDHVLTLQKTRVSAWVPIAAILVLLEIDGLEGYPAHSSGHIHLSMCPAIVSNYLMLLVHKVLLNLI